MLNLILIALVGSLEAVVYQGRYRATHGTARQAAYWTLAVCCLRVWFVALGVGVMLGEAGVFGAMACYAIPAAVVTGLVRRRERRCGERKLLVEVMKPKNTRGDT
jgi:hypothetical protein